MTEMTRRLALPLLQAGQAQKELYHNEALALLDIAVHTTVIDTDIEVPPLSPRIGDCWIVGADPQAEWVGEAGSIAGWSSGGWRFVRPTEGMIAWCMADTLWVQHIGDTWIKGRVAAGEIRIGGKKVVGAQQSPIVQPSGGTTIDTEARSAILAVILALRMHGLIAG